jgi:catechol 2,3-dioxygenase-like lactoylglutathione lyase family enzyme
MKLAIVLLALCFILRSTALGAGLDEQLQRPRITGIDHVTIYVSDLNRSRQFYSGDLGLTAGCPQYTGPETCFLVGPANQRVILKPAPSEAKSETLRNWLAEVAFRTDSVTEMQRYLLAHFAFTGTAGSKMTPSTGTKSRFPMAPIGSNTCSTFPQTPTTRAGGAKSLFSGRERCACCRKPASLKWIEDIRWPRGRSRR